MSKALEALEDLSKLVFIYGGQEQYRAIEKALKALEFIKPLVSVVDYRGTYYLVINNEGIQIDREKYELLSEVLK